MAREFGQGLILADQMPSCLDHATLANVYTTITLNLAANRDINAISSAMGLNSEQKQALNSLPLKTAIVKMAGRYTQPFQIHIPNLIVDKNITDTELATYMKPKLDALTPASPPQTNTQSDPEPEKKTPAQETATEISNNGLSLLWDIKNHPYTPSTERQKSMDISTHMGQKLYSELIDKDFVKVHNIKVNSRGCPQKFYELTSKAIDLAGKQNLGPGKGGFVHRLHQHFLKKVFENQGYKVKIEEYKNGKNVDLGLTKGNKSIAVEIAMSPTGEISNIEKDLAAGWTEVWTLCNSESIHKAIEKEWNRHDSAVKIQLLSDKQFL